MNEWIGRIKSDVKARTFLTLDDGCLSTTFENAGSDFALILLSPFFANVWYLIQILRCLRELEHIMLCNKEYLS